MAAPELTLAKRLFGTLFLESHFQNHPDSMLQKTPVVFKPKFKHNLSHMSSLYFTPTLPFEPRFCIFIVLSFLSFF